MTEEIKDLLKEIKEYINGIIEMSETGHLNPEVALDSIKEDAEHVNHVIITINYKIWEKEEEECENR